MSRLGESLMDSSVRTPSKKGVVIVPQSPTQDTTREVTTMQDPVSRAGGPRDINATLETPTQEGLTVTEPERQLSKVQSHGLIGINVKNRKLSPPIAESNEGLETTLYDDQKR